MKHQALLLIAVTTAATAIMGCHHKPKTEPTEIVSADETVIPDEALVMEESAEVTATVLDVNHHKREITVLNIDDEEHTIYVPTEVENFKEIKKGDSVVMNIYESVAFQMDDGTGINSNPEVDEDIMRIHSKNAPGDKPGMNEMQVNSMVATINHIDPASRMVKLMTDTGKVMNVKVSEDVEKFNQLSVGQKVDVTHVQSFALSVEKL